MRRNVITIMPAYNAAATIERVFERIPPEAWARIGQVAVVDDGSTDDTYAILTRLAEQRPNLVPLRHASNQGYGAAEKTLLHHAIEQDADAVILLHADGQYAPEMIPNLLIPLDMETADIVQGSRMLAAGALSGGMPLYKYVANKCLTALENRVLGLHLAEYHSGYLLYSRRILDRVQFDRLSNSFDFDLEMIVCARVLGMAVCEIAIPTRYAGETSHLQPIQYGLDVLKVLRRYKNGYYHDRVIHHTNKPGARR